MGSLLAPIYTLAVALLLCSSIPVSLAQSTGSSDKPQSQIALSKLSPPAYPPLARQTRVTGDVELIVGVRQDGSVESVVVVSGHPLLKQAALDSAMQSHFDCLKCSEAGTSYRLVYTFQLGPTKYCEETDGGSSNDQRQQHYPQVSQSQNRVTVVDQPVGTCDPAAELRKVRSVKCLYLWRCGSREYVRPSG